MFEFLESICLKIKQTCADYSAWTKSAVHTITDDRVSISGVEEVVAMAMLGCQQLVQRSQVQLLPSRKEEEEEGEEKGSSSQSALF